MNTDGKKPGSELDNLIEKLGLEEIEHNNSLPEEHLDDESLIDLNIIEKELKSNENKTKKVKKLNISIIAGGILIVLMLISILILKSCSGEGATAVDNGTAGFFDGQGTTAGDLDRPDNVTQPVIENTETETVTVNPSVR